MKNSNEFTRISLNTLYQLVGRITVIALSLATTIILRRYLGRHGYGEYIFFLNYLLIFLSLADIGTHLTTVKEANIQIGNKPKIIGYMIQLRLLLALVGCALALVVSRLFFSQNDFFYTILIADLAILFLSLRDICFIVYHTWDNLMLASLVNAAAALTQLGAVILMIVFHQNLSLFFTWYIFLLLVINLIFILDLNKRGYYLISFNLNQIIKLFKKSLPLGGVLILFTIYSKLDTLLIKHFFDQDAVGAYGLSYKIYENLTLPAAFLLNAILPSWARVYGDSKIFLKQTFFRVYLFLLFFSLIAAVALALFSPLIIKVITGGRLPLEIKILRTLSPALIFAYLNHASGYLIIVIGKVRLSLKIALAALLFNLIFNWFFLPRYGIIASAYITIATEALVLLLSLIVIQLDKDLRFLFKK